MLSSEQFEINRSNKLSQSASIEYGITEYLQIEFAGNRQPEIDENRIGGIEIEYEIEYELGLLYTLTKQKGFIPHFSFGASLVSEDDEYGYEVVLLASYELVEYHFLHLNFGFENINEEDVTFINAAYAYQVTDDFTLLFEFERHKEEVATENHYLVEYANQASIGFVSEIKENLEFGFAYHQYLSDDFFDSALRIKLSYEF
ncbi:hypothetical protein [Colwellia sp. TT2012]|uniref:hypothetical protein n=1 Tax=Colwellia sp. TT2012 TaxID=1720342 RepID=UPI00070E8E82|nr:hypothetical protein [Colwellia sp. TT2012]